MINFELTAAREVRVEVKVGEVLFPVSHVTLLHTLGQFPEVRFEVQLDNRNSKDPINAMLGSVDINLSRIASVTRVIQEKVLNTFGIKPDLKMTIMDGAGTHKFVEFKGYMGRPSVQLSNGKLSISFAGIHYKSGIQAFSPGVYVNQQYFSGLGVSDNGSVSDPFAFNTELRKSKSIAERIYLILNNIRKNYLEAPVVNSEDFKATPISNLNELVFPMIQQILQDSIKTTVLPGIEDEHFESLTMHNNIYRTLVSSPNFFQALQAMASMFLMQLNATWDGRFWMERIQTLDKPGERFIDVPVTDFNFELAHLHELPIVQVLVQGENSDLYMSGEFGARLAGADQPAAVDPTSAILAAQSQMQRSLRAVVAYPPKIKATDAGQYFIIQAPNWIGRTAFGTVDAETDLIAGRERFSDSIARADQLVSKMDLQNKARVKVLNWFAEQTFKELYLRNCVTSISTPLTMDMQVGRTYDVQSGDQMLFTGFMNAVTHEIAVGPEGGFARSLVEFSHIVAPNAKIKVLQP